MASLNRVMLIGHLGKDPETKFTPNGDAVCNFSIATSESWTDKSGTRQERTEWHNIVVWRKLAEICQKYLTKGRQVYIEGRIQSREYDAKDGSKRRVTEIVANQMVMLGSGKQEAASEQSDYTDSQIPF